MLIYHQAGRQCETVFRQSDFGLFYMRKTGGIEGGAA